MRINRLKRNYGLTPEQYKEMFDKQNGKCDMCKEPERIKLKSGALRKLAVDHNHKTGKNRGLLCAHCNTAIGMLRESIKIIRYAEDYLRRWGAAE